MPRTTAVHGHERDVVMVKVMDMVMGMLMDIVMDIVFVTVMDMGMVMVRYRAQGKYLLIILVYMVISTVN